MKFDFPPRQASGWSGTGEVPLIAFGATGDGITDDLAAIQAAVDSGENLLATPGTYLVDGSIMIRTGLQLRGMGMDGTTTFKSADFAHAPVFWATGGTTETPTSDFTLSDFKVDGNKDNMTDGESSSRGIYMQGTCARFRLARLWGADILDQGFILGGEDSIVEFCRVTDGGRESHLGEGGLGGSGFTGGHATMIFRKCHSINNTLAGFKATATLFEGCIARLNGGGFSSGSVSVNTEIGSTYSNCISEYNLTDGWYIRGQMDKIVFMGCIARYNDFCGIVLGDDTRSVIIGGGTRIYNNGQKSGITAPEDIFGAYNGIFLQAATVGGPVEVIISDTHIYDNQRVKTQDYGISSTTKPQRCVIESGCLINDHKVAKIRRLSHVSNLRVKAYNGSPLNSSVPFIGWSPTALGTNPFATTINSRVVTVTHTAHGRAVNDYVNLLDRSAFRALGANPLSTTASSATVTIAHTAHGAVVGETVEVRGAVAVGGITVFGRYVVATVPDANSITITHSAAATSTATGGGSDVEAGYWSLVGGLHTAGRFRIQTVPTANTYTIWHESTATATATGGGTGVTALYSTISDIAHTGSPNTVVRVASFHIPPAYLVAGSKFKVIVSGTVTGITCTKEIYLGTGSSAGTYGLISDQAIGEALNWWGEATFVCEAGNSVRGLIVGGEAGGTPVTVTTTHAINVQTTQLTILIMVQLTGLAGDTVTITSASIQADE